MQGITDPAQLHFKDGIWGYDPVAALWLPVHIVPATNRLMVDPGDDFEVHQTDPADMYTGLHGWDLTNWRPLGMLWGFSSKYIEHVEKLNCAVGGNTIYTSPVDAGYLHVIQAIAGINLITAPSSIVLAGQDGAIDVPLAVSGALGIGQWYYWQGEIVLHHEDMVYASVKGCALNDDIYLRAWGYRMHIAE